MKRTELIKRLEAAGLILKRHGGNHDIYFNPKTNQAVPVQRHREIPDVVAKNILKQAGIE